MPTTRPDVHYDAGGAFDRFEPAPRPPRPIPLPGLYRVWMRHDLATQPPPTERSLRSEGLGEASRAMRRRRERDGWGQLKPKNLELLGQ
jgi:hypothetical protein